MEAQSLRSLQKKRTTNFREDETKLLIQLWGNPQIQNKLYLTHRKEPVMRILAANMQHRGFYRTPDEIKTRIRNLKCLYHRIKRSVQSGSGFGTVDPDWPHYKAMDAILSKQNQKSKDIYKDNVFEGPQCDEPIKIKQEIDDIDINDDMESYTTNSMGGSEYEDDQINLPPLTPAPNKDKEKNSGQNKSVPTILPNLSLPIQNQINTNGRNQIPSLPFPLLILNGLQTQQNNNNQDKKDATKDSIMQQKTDDMTTVLKQLLDVQKENLDIEKQRLELDKQRLELERVIGSQLMVLAPVFGGVLQKLAFSSGICNDEKNETSTKNGRKRPNGGSLDIFKESKILRTLLDESIKKIVLGENDEDEESENEDSGIHNDENSRSSTK